MIQERQALSMIEAGNILKNVKETDKVKELRTFIQKFSKIESKKVGELKKDIQELKILKLRESDIVKIIEIMPEDGTELNKIFTEVSLDADETNKILETVKKFI